MVRYRYLGGAFVRFTPAQFNMLHDAAVAYLSGRVLAVPRRKVRTLAALERLGLLSRAQTSLYSISGERVVGACLTDKGRATMNVRVVYSRRGTPASRRAPVKLLLIQGGKK